MEKYAVIGYPLGHTMSPFIHNRMFKLNGINATYEAILTPPEKLTDTVNMLKAYNGFNIRGCKHRSQQKRQTFWLQHRC